MTGKLSKPFNKFYGSEMVLFSSCLDCGEEFIHINGKPKVNGKYIKLCPWCRKDSKPWKWGRGE